MVRMDGWTDRLILDKQAGRWTKEQRDKWLDTLMDGMVIKTIYIAHCQVFYLGTGLLIMKKVLKDLQKLL